MEFAEEAETSTRNTASDVLTHKVTARGSTSTHPGQFDYTRYAAARFRLPRRIPPNANIPKPNTLRVAGSGTVVT